MTDTLNLGDEHGLITVLDVPQETTEFVTTNGEYFVRGDAFIDSMHQLLHDAVLPMAEVAGRDTEAYANAGHALVNLLWESFDSLMLTVQFAMPAAEGHELPSADPQDD